MLKLVKGKDRIADGFRRKNYEGLKPLEDHYQLLDQYIQTHQMRNFTEDTTQRKKKVLNDWFNLHGHEGLPLYTWEAMEPIVGRHIMLGYSKTLIASEISSKTIRKHLGNLLRYFAFVIEHPYLIDEFNRTARIQDRYGPIEQPLSEFDMPSHVYNGEQQGVPLDPERLYDFYEIARKKYLPTVRADWIGARNYTLLVIAGESGLRIDEILHLEIDDLFFESKKIQTRSAKGSKGSGKRARTTLFTPLARDTMTYFLKKYRPKFENHNSSRLVFLTRFGTPMEYDSALNPLKEMVALAQKLNFPILDHMAWHWLRRIFATRFIERFPSQLPALIQLLGHVTPNTVHCYIRHSDCWIDEKIKDILEGDQSWGSNGN